MTKIIDLKDFCKVLYLNWHKLSSWGLNQCSIQSFITVQFYFEELVSKALYKLECNFRDKYIKCAKVCKMVKVEVKENYYPINGFLFSLTFKISLNASVSVCVCLR